MDLYLEFERPLDDAELPPLRDLVKRRGQGEPLQHLLGTVEFCGQTFLIDKRAMVPRPETEELVELISSFEFRVSNFRILDVGTGSGVIALSLAKKFPEAKVFGVDISEDALSLARENSARLELSERVEFQKRDLLENLSERFDLIVANLPYISMQDRHRFLFVFQLTPTVLTTNDCAGWNVQHLHRRIGRVHTLASWPT